jgi:uncharacterized protein (DUF362 family)
MMAGPEGAGNRVAVAACEARYPADPPFHPSARHPETPFPDVGAANPVYEAVRSALHLLGLDAEAFGSPSWNPFHRLVRPGDTVLLKPNWIRQGHPRRDEWQQVITHGAVIRAVLDYVFLAAEGKARVLIADGPQTDSDFDGICHRTGIAAVASYFRARGLGVEVLDLRRDLWFQRGDVIERRVVLPGDPAGYTTIDLGEDSAFEGRTLSGPYYGADYDSVETAEFHRDGRHVYILCRSALDADVVINLPKMKTHKKTGVTLSLKNLVGINGYRNCLPHHTRGTPRDGGDEFPVADLGHRVQGTAIHLFRRLLVARGGTGGAVARGIKSVGRIVWGSTERVIRSGNWSGNDTAWRMVLDLNRAFFHYGGDGRRRSTPVRYFSLVDGVIGGDGDGPAAPDAVASGIVVAGVDPVAVDAVSATLMGFDYRRLPVLSQAWAPSRLPLTPTSPDDIVCRSNQAEWNGSIAQLLQARHLGFRPHQAWSGTMERSEMAGALGRATEGNPLR